MKNLLLIAIAIFGFSAVSFGQATTGQVTDASATATILKTLTMSQTQPLVFGTFASDPTSAKTVVLDLNDDNTGGTATIYTVGAAPKTAVFRIDGTPLAAYTVTLPGVTTLTEPGGHQLTINAPDWITDLGATNVGSLNAAGIHDLKVGATLQVPALRNAGNYSATYTITVNYN